MFEGSDYFALAGGGLPSPAVAQFLIEAYVPGGDVDAARRGGVAASQAAEELSSEGTPIRYLHSLFVPEDETCFYLYEASELAAVDTAARRAGLTFERVAAAVSERAEQLA